MTNQYIQHHLPDSILGNLKYNYICSELAKETILEVVVKTFFACYKTLQKPAFHFPIWNCRWLLNGTLATAMRICIGININISTLTLLFSQSFLKLDNNYPCVL